MPKIVCEDVAQYSSHQLRKHVIEPLSGQIEEPHPGRSAGAVDKSPAFATAGSFAVCGRLIHGGNHRGAPKQG